jgi:hypothetical protein
MKQDFQSFKIKNKTNINKKNDDQISYKKLKKNRGEIKK